jgi:hypothetical protein
MPKEFVVESSTRSDLSRYPQMGQIEQSNTTYLHKDREPGEVIREMGHAGFKLSGITFRNDGRVLVEVWNKSRSGKTNVGFELVVNCIEERLVKDGVES